jgi:hypothetical protein
MRHYGRNRPAALTELFKLPTLEAAMINSDYVSNAAPTKSHAKSTDICARAEVVKRNKMSPSPLQSGTRFNLTEFFQAKAVRI